MKRTILNSALTLVALVGMSAAANAEVDTKPVGLSVRGGLFLPIDSASRDAGTSWVAFGVDYKLRELSIGGEKYKADLGLSIDYQSKGDFRSVPILLNYIGHIDDSIYYTAGAGISFTSMPSEDKARFAYQVGLGYNFKSSGTTPVFVEAKFFGSDHKEFNGFGVYVGVKF